jgi:GT2 family glycosyltransferase
LSTGQQRRQAAPSVAFLGAAIARDDNIGFTRGNNLGSDRSGRYQCCLTQTPSSRRRAEQAGALPGRASGCRDREPRVLNADGPPEHPAALPHPADSDLKARGCRCARRVLDHFYVTDQPDDGTFEVDWVQGCALAARREVYDQIGPLDPGYIMFSEELDWCRRAKDAGWRVAYVGDARITHYGGRSTEQVQAAKHIHFQQSKLRYFRKFHGRGLALALRVFLLLSYSAQIVQEGAKAFIGHKRPLRLERIRTYWQVIRMLAFHSQEM